MKRFLRFLMLALMVAYGTVGWGLDNPVEFRAGQNPHKGEQSISKNLHVGDKNSNVVTSDFTLTITGKATFEAVGGTDPSWNLSDGDLFTVSSSKYIITHIHISFYRQGLHTTGGERIYSPKNVGDEWGSWTGCDGSARRGYSDGYWKPKEGDVGRNSITLRVSGSHGAKILWLKVWYLDTNSGTTNTGNLSVTGSDYFLEGKSDATVSGTGYSAIYWVYDNSDPITSGSHKSGAVSKYADLPYSCVVKAVGKRTVNASTNSDNTTITMYDVASKHFTKRYKLDITPSGYSTLCHYNNLNVPSGCTAYVYTKGTGSAGGFKTKLALICDKTNIYSSTGSNKVIPAGQAVIVKANTTPTKTTSYYFENPDYDSNSGANTFTNVLTGNPNSTQQTTGFDTSKKYYYLMYSPYGDNKLGFYYGESGGAAIGTVSGSTKSNIHKAWLVLGSGEAAKGFTFYLPDDESAPTAIGGIRADNTVDDNAPMYNAAGQRVGSNYKGIVIQNGRKFIKR